jgi:hypothetical protein
MALPLSPAERAYLGLPPRPLMPTQQIVTQGGVPTYEFHTFLTQQYEWERRLLSLLTAEPYPALRVLERR